MPPYVIAEKCDGCKGKAEPLCEQICIGNLMTLDPKAGKAYCRSLRDCWDCMSCTKLCPKGAIEQRLPYQIGYFGAKLIPMMGPDSITWTCVDIHGKVERFSFRTRNKK